MSGVAWATSDSLPENRLLEQILMLFGRLKQKFNALRTRATIATELEALERSAASEPLSVNRLSHRPDAKAVRRLRCLFNTLMRRFPVIEVAVRPKEQAKEGGEHASAAPNPLIHTKIDLQHAKGVF